MRSVAPRAFIVLLFVLLVDALSKIFIEVNIPPTSSYILDYPYGGIPVFKDFFGVEFSIVHVINKGAAWGAFPHYQQELLYVRLALVAALFAYLLFALKTPGAEIPLALVIAGALGNVIDTFLYGHVIDMLHFILWGYDFPSFNIADSAICLGVVWLAFASWRIVPANAANGKKSAKSKV